MKSIFSVKYLNFLPSLIPNNGGTKEYNLPLVIIGRQYSNINFRNKDLICAPSGSASAPIMIFSHIHLEISKLLPYPAPIIVKIAPTSSFAKNLALGVLNAFGILPLIGNMPCRLEQRQDLPEPAAESPSIIINSRCSLPVGFVYFFGKPLITDG